MDTNKYLTPKLPTASNILDDLRDLNEIQINEDLKVTNFQDTLCDAYICYRNYNNLQKDLVRQNELSNKLKELQEELIKNIENMKKQQ